MKRFFLLAGLGTAILLLLAIGVFRPFTDLTRRAFLPLLRQVAAGSQVIERFFPEHDQATSQQLLTQCEGRVRTLAVDEARLAALEEENKTLRAQAKFAISSGYDQVGALVISRELGTLRGRLTIDRGANDHVEIGQAVVTDEGIYIGRISAVETRVATVELLSDTDSRVAAATIAGDALVGVVEGRGNGAASLTYVPSSINLAADQIIVTAGTEEKIPSHLPLGIINSITRTPKDPFYSASVDPLVRFDRVTYVSVLRPEALRPSL
jgi:rod shape-determining protein MreC